VREFLFPRSVAVVGASPKADTIGGQILIQLLKGFQGRTYAVNPKYRSEKIGGQVVQFYGKVTHLPETPELVVVATPANTVPQVVEEAGQAGARAVVVVSGGFAEVGRRDLEEELVSVAKKYGVRVLGPNCVGVYNAFNGLDTMFLPAEKAARPPPGPVAFLSQSGAVMTAVLDWAAEEGVGVGIAVNFGNRADVTEGDFLQYLDEVEEVKTVALYLEGFRWRGDAARFLASARRMKKPVVVYKAGRGADSRRAVASHTAAMAGSYEMYKALFRQAGVVAVDDLVELFDAAKALAMYKPVKVEKVLVISSSGGMGVQIVDALNAAGFSVPELPREAQEELRRLLSPIAAVSNPVDLTGGGVDEHFGAALEVGLKYVDAAVVAALIHPPGYSDKSADYILAAYEKWGKPILVVSFGSSPQVKTLEKKLRGKLVVVNTPSRAAKALSAVAFYGSKIYNGGDKRRQKHEAGQGVDSGVSPASGGVAPQQYGGCHKPGACGEGGFDVGIKGVGEDY
jgi:acyl-CoA synthetase (NDP forming)